jgi:hypothetical protein
VQEKVRGELESFSKKVPLVPSPAEGPQPTKPPVRAPAALWSAVRTPQNPKQVIAHAIESLRADSLDFSSLPADTLPDKGSARAADH